MAEEIRTWDVAGEGTGKPDYSKEISKGRIEQGILLAHNQSLKTFMLLLTNQNVGNPFNFVKAPLPVGATTPLVDVETGFNMPYTFPAGHTFTIKMDWHSFSQPMDGRIYLDGFHYASGYADSLETWYEQDVIPFDSTYFDPLALLPHLWAVTATNLGIAAAQGQIIQSFVVTAVGTPPLKPKTKTVQCKWCKAKFKVKREETRIECKKCGETFIVFNLP